MKSGRHVNLISLVPLMLLHHLLPRLLPESQPLKAPSSHPRCVTLCQVSLLRRLPVLLVARPWKSVLVIWDIPIRVSRMPSKLQQTRRILQNLFLFIPSHLDHRQGMSSDPRGQ